MTPEREALRKIVWDNLDSALQGGQQIGTAEDEANELICYAEDCESYSTAELLPHVRSWMLAKFYWT